MTSRYETYKVLKELTPWDLVNEEKLKIGSRNDSGYILANKFENCDCVLSFGAGHDISFDQYFSSIGIKVFLFDPYVENLVVNDKNIMFLRIGLKAEPDNNVVSYNLCQILEIFNLKQKKNLILKMDIEGDEWNIFDQASLEELECFSQIVVEIHWLNNLNSKDYSDRAFRVFEKLNKIFTLFHIHGNNCAPVVNVNGFPVADVLELSFIRTCDVKRVDSSTTYPTKLDSANDRFNPDHLLWFFPFVPTVTSEKNDSFVSCDLDSENPILFKNPIIIDSKFKSFNVNRGVKPKILYTSCHEILEYDELRMLTELGYTVFSTGTFSNPTSQGTFRKPLGTLFNPDLYREFLDGGSKVSSEFLSLFDMAIVMHEAHWVEQILSCNPNFPVIYRSIGQSIPEYEAKLKSYEDRMVVVRYSEKECGIDGFLKEDAIIYFGKYLEDFQCWTGGDRLMTFYNSYTHRSHACAPNVEFYKRISDFFDHQIAGAGNEDLSGNIGLISSDNQNDFYRKCSLYFYVHSMLPSYTLNFIEALGAGAPIVAPSTNFLQTAFTDDFFKAMGFPLSRYEIDDFLNHDTSLLYDSFDDAVIKIRWLLDNPSYTQTVSKKAQKTFREYFDARQISRQWDKLIMSLG